MEKKTKRTIQDYRKKIDEIDDKILTLLSQRGKAAQAIGKLKKKQGHKFHVPEREVALLRRLKERNAGPYSSETIGIIFREIISASLSLEAPLNVAYLGPKASYTNIATIRKFGASVNLLPQENINDVFLEVANSRVDYGVVPIENSTEGIVNQTLDLFMEYSVQISGEIQLAIHHNLLSHSADLKKIKKVYSHIQAISQCRSWLKINLPQARLVPVSSTSRAAELVQTEKTAAAISSEFASSLYNVPIIKSNIEDHPNNFTRFIVIGRTAAAVTGHDKTSLMFSTLDKPGILFKVLKAFADQDINLTSIESRPIKKNAWQYIFFVDLEGHIHEQSVQKAVEKLQTVCSFVHILGSYPKEVGN